MDWTTNGRIFDKDGAKVWPPADDDDGDDQPQLPDDPNHPHAWGRPIVLSEAGVKMANEMIATGRPQWLIDLIGKKP